jgi:hypothetical protein
MIEINPSGRLRQLSESDLAELIPVVERITRRAARAAENLARFYGDLDRHDPEWRVLCQAVATIIRAWAGTIRLLGAEPQELWSVEFVSVTGAVRWQLAGAHAAGILRPAS